MAFFACCSLLAVFVIVFKCARTVIHHSLSQRLSFVASNCEKKRNINRVGSNFKRKLNGLLQKLTALRFFQRIVRRPFARRSERKKCLRIHSFYLRILFILDSDCCCRWYRENNIDDDDAYLISFMCTCTTLEQSFQRPQTSFSWLFIFLLWCV